MIISDKYQYVFVELPHTGSTAISEELCTYYDGHPILRKHAFYHEFLKQASEERKRYYVFSCIRNPMDDVVSRYFKLLTDHEDYTNPKKHVKKGGFVNNRLLRKVRYVRDTKCDFRQYFKKFYKIPYDNWSRLAHHKFDYVIRFEDLQGGFSKVLKDLAIEPVRELPVVNETSKPKSSFIGYYPPDLRNRVRWVFGPFMKTWKYDFPEEFGNTQTPLSALCLYELMGLIRIIKWRWFKNL